MGDGKVFKRRVLNGVKYEIEAFHPLAFGDDEYVVRFYQAGKPKLDRYMRSTIVRAQNPNQAIELAIDSEF